MTDPTAGAAKVLQRTQPWVRLASIVALLMSALMASFAVDAMLGGLTSQRFETMPFLILYLALTVVFLFPAFYLHKYAKRIVVFVAQGHAVQLESALEAQRKFWKFMGIVALLIFVILTLVAGLSVL